MPWTADDLVNAVRVRAQLPDAAGDGAITDADILTLANEEIALRLVPLVRRSRGDYFVTTLDVAIVNGTSSYRVPTRAQTSGLRELTIIDSSGREWPVPQMHLEDAGPAQTVGGGYGSVRFYMQGADVVLVPTPTYADCTLRMRYHRSHARLLPTSESFSLYNSSVQLGPNPILVGRDTSTTEDYDTPIYAVSAWYQIGTTAPVDIYWATPPFGVASLEASVTSNGGVAPEIEFVYSSATAIPEDVWLVASLVGTTSIVDLPLECWPLLVSAVTARVCEVIGDRDAAAMAFGLYDREQANIMTLLAPRVEGNKQVLVDRFSTLRSGRGGGRGGWR